MEKLTKNLSGGETLFLYLGTILFIVLLILLIIYAAQKREIKPLLVFFILPVIMIGWPTIKSLKISGDGIELNKEDIELATSNPEKKAQLVKLTDSLNMVSITSPDSLKLLAQANAVLGDTVKAVRNLEKALEKDPGDTEAQNLKHIYFTPDVKIKKGIEDVKADPKNDKIKNELRSNLIIEEQKSADNKADMLSIAAAHLVLEDTAKSNMALEKAVEQKPALQNFNNAKAVMMKNYIK